MTGAFESIFIEIEIPTGKNILIGEIYKPPNCKFTDFTGMLHSTLDSPCLQNKYRFIMGDFNLNLLHYHDKPHCQEFLDAMISNALIPCITKPTRLADTTTTLIDNVFTNIHSRLMPLSELPEFRSTLYVN